MALSLHDLRFVMGEPEIMTASVQIEWSTEMIEAHRRALDVPSGSARAPWARPGRLIRFRGLPKSEVPVISLRGRLISGSTARTLLHRIEGLSSQCPELGRSALTAK